MPERGSPRNPRWESQIGDATEDGESGMIPPIPSQSGVGMGMIRVPAILWQIGDGTPAPSPTIPRPRTNRGSLNLKGGPVRGSPCFKLLFYDRSSIIADGAQT